MGDDSPLQILLPFLLSFLLSWRLSSSVATGSARSTVNLPPFTPAPAPEIAPLNPFPPADAIDCGQYKQSLALCGKMLKKNEDVAIVKALMGLTHYRMDQKKEALLLADEARAMRPTDLETLQALAHTYKPLQKRMSYTYLSLSLASCLLPPACLPPVWIAVLLTFSFLFSFFSSFFSFLR